MGQYKFFSIVFSAFLIGCATVPAPTPTGYEYFPKGIFTNKDGEVYLSTVEPTILDQILSKPGATEMEIAKKVREYYCQASTQKHAMKYNLKLIMPKVEAGIPIDEASKILDMRMNLSRTFLKNFFVMAASNGPFRDLNLAVQATEKGLTGEDMILSGKSERIKQISNDDYLNSSEAKDGLIPRVIEKDGYSSKGLIRSLINDNILFIFNPTENLFLVVTNTLVYKTKPSETLHYKRLMSQASSSDEKKSSFVNAWNAKLKSIDSSIKNFGHQNAEIPLTFISPSQVQREIDGNESLYGKESTNPRGFFVITDAAGEVAVQPDPTRVTQQLSDATQFELSILTRNYLLVLPDEIQLELFGNDEYGKNRYGLQSKEVVIKKTIEDSSKSWGHYLAVATTIKESPTSDPQVYNYQVELGLDIFCKYGRAKNDLLSR